jgi:transposase
MALGKRAVKQSEMFIPVAELPKSPAHPFYSRLNRLLAEADFDSFVETLCEPYYREGGRPSIPPGVYFRMLFIGYFEGIDSQRGVAWRCADSRSLREFLGAAPTDPTPAHNSMTVIRQRLPESVFEAVFSKVLSVLQEKGLLKGKTLGVDATTLEANAAMKSIVRKADGKDWKNYLRTLAQAEGIEEPSDDDLRRIDRGRKGKKVSNETWESPVDGDARIARMKDGTTRLAYKAEHAVDLETQAIVNAQIHHANRGDAQTGRESLILAQVELGRAGSEAAVEELVADKGYHDNGLLTECAHFGIRTYIPERKQAKRVWVNKPPEMQGAFRANRRRVRGERGRKLNRWRSERVERTFAHICETGGGRRSWLRGLINVQKAHLLRCCAYNLGLVMRKCYGMGKPRSGASAAIAILVLLTTITSAMRSSQLPWEYLPQLLPYALALLLLAAWAHYITTLFPITPENRGS